MCGFCNNRDRGVCRVGHAGRFDVSLAAGGKKAGSSCFGRGRLLFDVELAS